MAGAEIFLPPKTAALTFLLGMGIALPTALAFSKLIDASAITSDHPLASLGGQIAALNGLFLPVMIIVSVHIPLWTPFIMAVLGGHSSSRPGGCTTARAASSCRLVWRLGPQ